MTTFLPAEKGMTIRQPSTANLMLDSADRNRDRNPSPWDFQITRPQALLNGFFTRIGTTELVLEWDTPSISGPSQAVDASGARSLVLDINGYGAGPLLIPYQNCWVKSAAFFYDNLVARVNDLSGTTNFYFTFDVSGSVYNLIGHTNGGTTTGHYKFQDSTLAQMAQLGGAGPYYNTMKTAREINAPDFRIVRYLDFISPQLTYNQDLKDASTKVKVVDVLARWYMDYDQENSLDKYGFPIYMGYNPFQLRRLFNPPKQIRWDNIQPLGNLSFQVWATRWPQNRTRNFTYGPFDVPQYYNTEWLMTLQISEC